MHPDIAELYEKHYARDDLIYFTDDKPEVEIQACLIQDSKIIQPAGVYLKTRPIPNRQCRLITLSGIGDNFWTRGIIRQYLAAGMKLWVDTSFPWVYWDFVGMPGFNFWTPDVLPPDQYGTRTATYLGEDLYNTQQTVYGAMCRRCRVTPGDFKFPIRPDWLEAADALIASWNPKKPLMLFRPLVENPGRRSVSVRNPNAIHYAQLFAHLRKKFFTVSIQGGHGENVIWKGSADITLHDNAIPITTAMALMYRAKLIYTYPGMGLVAAGAIGTPVIALCGGYEGPANYTDTTIYGPSLYIPCVEQCYCLSDSHPCNKFVDMPKAISATDAFLQELQL